MLKMWIQLKNINSNHNPYFPSQFKDSITARHLSKVMRKSCIELVHGQLVSSLNHHRTFFFIFYFLKRKEKEHLCHKKRGKNNGLDLEGGALHPSCKAYTVFIIIIIILFFPNQTLIELIDTALISFYLFTYILQNNYSLQYVFSNMINSYHLH